MNRQRVDRIVEAVLYEGYLLYPYRPSVKNVQRWTFGGVYPRIWSEAQGGSDGWLMQTEVLVEGSPETELAVEVRFLRPMVRTVGRLPEPLPELPAEPELEPVSELVVGRQIYQTWDEATEERLALERSSLQQLLEHPLEHPFTYRASQAMEPLTEPDGPVVGALKREQRAVQGRIQLGATQVEPGLYRVRVRIENHTPVPPDLERPEVERRALASCHTLLEATDGAFVSLTDPGTHKAAAEACKQVGTWPVLVGEAGERDGVLSSRIILPDHPEIAPESPGDFFDATEIDEMLTLRILTLTDDEKARAAALDPKGRELLERTERVAREQLMRMHGTMREVRRIEERPRLMHVSVKGVELGPGDRIRLRPKRRADAMDMMLDGMVATIEAVEEDYEDRVFVAVAIDADPGRDLGMERQVGHRFFFHLDEIEPL